MTKIRIHVSTLVVVSVIAAAMLLMPQRGAWAQSRTKIPSAYEQLPMDRLIKQLSILGMTDLLQAMEDEIPADDDSFQAQATRGRIRMGLANAMADPDDRNTKMDQAIAILRQAVKKAQASESEDPAEKVKEYRVTFELAAALGRYRVENPHILRLRLLLGNEEDKKVVLQKTQEAVDLLDFLQDRISRTLTGFRTNMEQYIRFGPPLEDLQREVRYNAGWIRLYRAMALGHNAECAELARNVVADMRDFVDDPDSGVMGWAQYATGIAYRLLADCDKDIADKIINDPKRKGEAEAHYKKATEYFEQAEKFLKKVAENDQENKDLRQRAWFERVRNRIDEGVDSKIDNALAEFKKASVEIWGEQQRVIADLRLVLLESYRVEVAAAKETDPAKRKALFNESQTVLMSFVAKYADRPALIMSFLKMVNTKFAGDIDVKNASAIVCLAKAYAKLDGKTQADKDEGEKLLLRVLHHEDLKKNPKLAQAIEPGVLYQLAFIMNERKLNVEASKYFIRLAKKYPEHELARKCAKFAVRSLYGVFSERQAFGEIIPTSLRLEYIRALDTMLDNFADANSVKWNFDLGAQCADLAKQYDDPAVKFYWQVRALSADEKVPPSLLEYMEAQHAALEARTQIVLNHDELAKLLTGDPARLKDSLRDLAATLVDLDEVSLPDDEVATTMPASAPAEGATTKPAVSAVNKKIDETAKMLVADLEKYSDPAALIERLSKYGVDAMAESRKAAAKAAAAATEADKKLYEDNAEGLKEWAHQAEYQAAVIKYEQLPKAVAGDDAAKRAEIERSALGDLQTLIAKLQAEGSTTGQGREYSPVLPMANEFEIRKLIELGRTNDAIAKIQDFKKTFPTQAKQLIGLLVQQIQARINKLERDLRNAVTENDAKSIRDSLGVYQRAYVNFAKDLYSAVADKPIKLPEIELLLRELKAKESAGDFAGLLKLAESVPALAASNQVDLKELKGQDVQKYEGVLSAAKAAGANRQTILHDLAAGATNVVLDVRDVVLERYGLIQMYADSLVSKGRAEKLAKNEAESKAAYQQALDLFKKCYDVDEACRKGESEWIAAKYAPFVAEVKNSAKGMDSVSQMVKKFREQLKAAGIKESEFPDMGSVQYAQEYLANSGTSAEEQKRLPRAVELLVRAWGNFVKMLQNSTTVDHINIIGMARANRGLGNYGEAMGLYRRYTEGISYKDFPKIYWQAELERCQCNLEGYRSKPKAMKNLVIQIKSLKVKDGAMGGLANEFDVIKNEAIKAGGVSAK